MQGRDHPVLVGVPETHYLKCFMLRRRRVMLVAGVAWDPPEGGPYVAQSSGGGTRRLVACSNA